MDIIKKFGDKVGSEALTDPEKARRLLLTGYRLQEKRLRFFPDKELPSSGQYVARVVMRNIIHGSCGKIGSDSHKKLPVLDVEETKSRFFLRLQVENRAGALANIAGVLGNNDVSIAQMVQKRSHDGIAEIVVITDLVTERHFNDAIRIMEGMSVVREISGIIRVY